VYIYSVGLKTYQPICLKCITHTIFINHSHVKKPTRNEGKLTLTDTDTCFYFTPTLFFIYFYTKLIKKVSGYQSLQF